MENKERFNLLVPIACDFGPMDLNAIEINTYVEPYDRSKYVGQSPKKVHGCIAAISGLNLHQFTDIYFVYNQDLDKMFDAKDKLVFETNMLIKHKRLDKNTNVHFVELKESTTSQVDTIYQAICKEDIFGPIVIKDSDNMCFIHGDIPAENGLFIFNTEDCSLVNPRDKSFVSLDSNGLIDNTIEHKLIGNYFNCGGYVFRSTDMLRKYIEETRKFIDEEDLFNPPLYLSNIIYKLLLDEEVFMPIYATYYTDYAI